MQQLTKIYRGATTESTAFENAKADADMLAKQGWLVQSMAVHDFQLAGWGNSDRWQTECIVSYHRKLKPLKTLSWGEMGKNTRLIRKRKLEAKQKAEALKAVQQKEAKLLQEEQKRSAEVLEEFFDDDLNFS